MNPFNVSILILFCLTDNVLTFDSLFYNNASLIYFKPLPLIKFNDKSIFSIVVLTFKDSDMNLHPLTLIQLPLKFRFTNDLFEVNYELSYLAPATPN